MAAQPAFGGQRAGVAGISKALGKGHPRLEQPEHPPDRDICRRMGQPQPAGAAAKRGDETAQLQLVDHLRQMVGRSIAGLRDVRGAHGAARIGGAEHQRSDGKVGACGQSHGASG